MTLDYRNPMHVATTQRSTSWRTVVGWSVGVLVALALAVTCLLPSLGRARETANRVKCGSNLRQIGQAAFLYANENGGHLGPDLPTLFRTQDITAEVFVCPSSSVDKATGATTQQVEASMLAGNHVSYAWTGGGLTTATVTADVILAFDLERHVPKDGVTTTGINVLLGDGSVMFVDEVTAAAIRARFVSGVRPILLSKCARPAATLPAALP